MIRGVHYLLHLLLQGIFNWKEKRQRREWVRYFSLFLLLPPHTLTFQSVFPSASWAGDHFDGEMWVDVSVFALTEPAWCHGGFGIHLSAGEGWKRWRERGRESKTCWQALHRQLQTSGRPGESVLNLCQRKGEKKNRMVKQSKTDLCTDAHFTSFKASHQINLTFYTVKYFVTFRICVMATIAARLYILYSLCNVDILQPQ